MMKDKPRFRHTNLPEGISRRDFLRMAGIGAAGMLLNACGLGPAGSPTVQENNRVVYQDWRTEWFPGMVQQMLPQFQQVHPDIQVFYVPDPVDVETSLIQDLEVGTGPDVFAACCSFFPIIAQSNLALDLRPFIEADLDAATIADWDPVQFRALSTRSGVQYGLPKYHGALALYYNKDIFDRYGVDYPDGSWNYHDYAEAMRRLSRDRNGDGKIDLWGSMLDVSWERIQVHINAWGGNIVDPNDPTKSRLADQPALDAMEWLRARIWDDRSMATLLDVQNVETRQAFIDQRIAMVEDGSWALKDILSEARFRIGLAPVPSGPVRRATLATTDGFGVYAHTRHPESAWKLLKFLIGPEYGRAMAQANFLQPARASLVGYWVKTIQDQYPDQTKDMDIAVFADGHLRGYSVTAEVFEKMLDAKRIIYEAWDQIFTYGQEPVEIMKEVSREIDAAQQKSGEG